MQEFKKVFIIDDDKVFHFIIKKLLQKNNSSIIPFFFENGQDAIDELKKRKHSPEEFPDLILLDINMPILDGWQFLEEFKLLKNELNKKPLIYLISSSDDNVDITKSKTYKDEIVAYLLKPLSLEDINKIF